MIDDWLLLARNCFTAQRVQPVNPALAGHKINSGKGSDRSKNTHNYFKSASFLGRPVHAFYL
jgi:hypothetical protein